MTKRILIVDDEAEFAELVRHRLQDARFVFEYAAHGMDALDKVKLARPDLVLLDLLLPDLDGLTLCSILTRESDPGRVPVILISAVDTGVTQAAAWEAGAREFFGKPVDFERLKLALEG